MEGRGAVEDLVFQYAAVHDLCTKRGLDPAECAGFKRVEKSSVYSPFDELLSTFSTTTPLCKSSSKLPTEHLGSEGGVGYDPSVMSQEVGTTLGGQFKSYRYLMKPVYNLTVDVQSKAGKYLSTTKGKVKKDYTLVCLACRRGDKTAGDQKSSTYTAVGH